MPYEWTNGKLEELWDETDEDVEILEGELFIDEFWFDTFVCEGLFVLLFAWTWAAAAYLNNNK